MSTVTDPIEIIEHAPIATWFAVGGAADRLARPVSPEQIAGCVRMEGAVRVLGDGANLLVDDDGIDGLVLDTRRLDRVEIDAARGLVRAGAGARLPQLINDTVRAGLGGLEVLAGIPASVGGAVVMNAGGKFGEIAGVVRAVDSIDASGEPVRLERSEIAFAYRSSGLDGLIVTAAEFELTPEDPAAVRDRQKSCMAYKKSTQPLGADSAGCCFKNPTLPHDLEGIAPAGERVGAGLLLDRAGCKGLRVGGAKVSAAHANFIITHPGARAKEVITLMDRAAARVMDRFGVRLEREVVIWERSR